MTATVPVRGLTKRYGPVTALNEVSVNLAAALLGDPQVIVLDEPATGLDVHGVAWLRRQLCDWAGAGRTGPRSSARDTTRTIFMRYRWYLR